jgi:hypothetical protein
MHYVERLHEAGTQPSHGHADEPEAERAAAPHLRHQQEENAMHEHEGTTEHEAFRIPSALKKEHEELHAELVRATKLGGPVGEAAEAVAKALHPHFVKEEEYALPPLGLLPALAEGQVTPDMRAVLRLTDRLRKDMPEMLAEHQAVMAELKKLTEVARAERQHEVVQFAEKLGLHAQTEEQVLYPAALLVGEYVKLRLAP